MGHADYPAALFSIPLPLQTQGCFARHAALLLLLSFLRQDLCLPPGLHPCLVRNMQNDTTSAPSSLSYRPPRLGTAYSGPVPIHEAEAQPLGVEVPAALGEAATGLGQGRAGLMTAPRVQRRKGCDGMEDQCFFFFFFFWLSLFFDGRVGSSLYNGVGHTPISCLNFPICKL